VVMPIRAVRWEMHLNSADAMTTPRHKGEAEETDRLRELGHLSSSAGHHIINAFSAIVSNAELIRSLAAPVNPSELDALGSSMIETALDASQVARRLIDWARSVTAVEGSQSGQELLTVDLNQLIGAMIESEKIAELPAVDWVLDLAPIPSIPGDTGQLRSMFRYLVQNAREALPCGSGTMEFSTLCDAGSWVVIVIRDSGSGMTPEVLRRATEPFFSTKPDHSGIGLTIAQGIWRRHGGAFSIDSHPGQGTTIRLSIGPFPSSSQIDPSPPVLPPGEFPQTPWE
jgi:two-component system, NtrC family, sensor kinase